MARASSVRVSELTQSGWNPLSRMRTHEHVIAEIESRLVTGSLKAGDRLPPERQFAEALGVSRGAVRESLRVLEAFGVVQAGTGSGPSAGSVIKSDGVAGMALFLRLHLHTASFKFDDVVQTRRAIQGSAARIAAESAAVGDIADLRSLVDEMRSARTVAEYVELDATFHLRMVGVSDNELATVLLAALLEAQRDRVVTSFESIDASQSLTDNLAAVVDAIVACDGHRAAEMMSQHLDAFYRTAGLGELGGAGSHRVNTPPRVTAAGPVPVR